MSLLWAVLIATAAFMLPGLVLSWLSGLKLPAATAASVPVTFGVYGLAAWLYGVMNIRYDVASVAVFFAVSVLVAGLWRWAVDRKKLRSLRAGELEWKQQWKLKLRPTWEGAFWVLPAVGTLAGAGLLGWRSLWLLDQRGVESIFQGWDVHWHASVLRFISNTGVAAPQRMGELQNVETHGMAYYPTGWHAGAWIAGDLAHLSPIAATNVAGILIPALALPMSMAVLAWRIMASRGLTAQIAAGFAPIIVVAIPAMYWVGIFIGAWPYLAALCMVGSTLWLFTSCAAAPRRILAAAVAFAGCFQTHPAAVTVVVVGVALWWLLWALPAPQTQLSTEGRAPWLLRRLADVGALAAAGGLGTVLVLPQIIAGNTQTEEVQAFNNYEAITRQEAWEMVLTLQTRHAGDFGVNEPLLWAAAAGGVIILLWRRNVWAPLMYVLMVGATVNSLVPFEGTIHNILWAYGSMHYNVNSRLVMPVAMLTAASAAIAIASVGRLIVWVLLRRWQRVCAIVSVLAALGGGAVLANKAYADTVDASVFGIVAARDNRLTSEADLRAFDWLAKQPKAFEGRILTNPAEGSGWMYAYNNLPALFRHYVWPDAKPGSDTLAAYWATDKLGRGNFDDPDEANAVDIAVDNLDINYIMVSPPSFWWFQFPMESLEYGLWTTPGTTLVYHDGDVRIFAVNKHFTDAQINAMRDSGDSPTPLPHHPTMGELGIAKDPADANKPYYHRWKTNNNPLKEYPYDWSDMYSARQFEATNAAIEANQQAVLDALKEREK